MSETLNPKMPAPVVPNPVRQLIYSGKASTLYGILLKNLILSLCTLGIYIFWGRTKRRRYIWKNFRFLNEPFSYLGTGSELFRSYFRFVFLVMLPIILLGALLGFLEGKVPNYVDFLINALIFIWIALYMAYAKYSGLRYRLSRSSLRGLRFQLKGSAREFFFMQIRILFLKVITLNLYRPIGDVLTLNYIINHMYYGNKRFRYNGKVEELQKTFLLCWLFFIPTLGCSMYWYRAKYYAHISKHTRFEQIEFRCKMTGGELFRLFFGNILIVLLSIGVLYPYAVHRNIIFFKNHFKYRGVLKFDQLGQAEKMGGSEGAQLYLDGDDIGL